MSARPSSPTPTTPQREYPLLPPPRAHPLQPTAPRGRPPPAQGAPRLRRPRQRRVRPSPLPPSHSPTPSRKMVNVNAQFPFNLHNQEHSSSCSSRNVSGATLAGSRAASPSPPRALHTSPSTASLSDAEDVPHYLPLVVNPSVPILNVHLVKFARSNSTRGRCGEPNSRTPAQLAPDEDPRSSSTVQQVRPLLLPCPRDHHEPSTMQSSLSTQERHPRPRTSIYMTLAPWHAHGVTDHFFPCLHHVHFRTSPYILPSITHPFLFRYLLSPPRISFHHLLSDLGVA
jgi:hypothetical protein